MRQIDEPALITTMARIAHASNGMPTTPPSTAARNVGWGTIAHKPRSGSGGPPAPPATPGRVRPARRRRARPGRAHQRRVHPRTRRRGYVCRNDLRERLRGFVQDVPTSLDAREDVATIVINSHSQATVLTLDVLGRYVPDKLAGLITAGNPLASALRRHCVDPSGMWPCVSACQGPTCVGMSGPDGEAAGCGESQRGGGDDGRAHCCAALLAGLTTQGSVSACRRRHGPNERCWW